MFYFIACPSSLLPASSCSSCLFPVPFPPQVDIDVIISDGVSYYEVCPLYGRLLTTVRAVMFFFFWN